MGKLIQLGYITISVKRKNSANNIKTKGIDNDNRNYRIDITDGRYDEAKKIWIVSILNTLIIILATYVVILKKRILYIENGIGKGDISIMIIG